MKNELKMIKKLYGEQMVHYCRDNFATILEEDGVLLHILTSNFNPSHNIYNDLYLSRSLDEFKNFIFNKFESRDKKFPDATESPKELLAKAGYDLYECHTEEEIQNFRKYYARGEELCTFRGLRLNKCHVFFAVKKDVAEIKREDYPHPERQDRYGTSVISIQFTKDGSHTLSIKNRYNHAVPNPDATFSNNLDNIINGLTMSFEKYYGLKQQNPSYSFEMPNYVCANDGKFYRYNYEMNNIYYCPDNIIIDNFEVKKYEKEKYVIFDYFILDLVNKKITLYDSKRQDGLIDTLKDIEKIEVIKGKEDKLINITLKDKEEVKITLNDNNEIIKIESNDLKKIGDNFLHYNKTLEEIDLPGVLVVGNRFLTKNKKITKINLASLQKIGNEFLIKNNSLEELILPNVEAIGDDFLISNRSLQVFKAPELTWVGHNFLKYNIAITELDLPSLKRAGNQFIYFNNNIQVVNLPNLEEVGDSFLGFNDVLLELSLPKLQKAGSHFLYLNRSLEKLDLPMLRKVGSHFLYLNKTITEINAPNNNLRVFWFKILNEQKKKNATNSRR